MKRIFTLVPAALLFALLATANSGGYRYGISDQAFYQPAVALSLDPALFPRDRVVLESQTKLWLGDSVLAWGARLVGGDLPTLFMAVYGITMVALLAAALVLARSLGMNHWAAAAFLMLLTLRHRIPKTGANSIEGYMHPRVLAFALGLGVFAAIVRNRTGAAVLLTAAAALVHTTVAIWFGAALVVAIAWRLGRRNGTLLLVATAVAAAVTLASVDRLRWRLTTMDPAWVAVLADKDYLFVSGWPVYAWILNLAYPVVLVAIYRRRLAIQQAVPGEAALVAGLLALAAVFLASVPFNLARMALAVELQINRVFWLLDAVVMLYLAWWLTTDLERRWKGARRGVVAVLLAVSAARGVYIVSIEAERKLVEVDLSPTAWTDAMRWIRAQPPSWHVLADPLHASTLGPSVRVAAERDTFLEWNKDSALAMYDPLVAMRLAERQRALGDFSAISLADLRSLAATYELDVLVDRTTRHYDLPVLYRNDKFLVYDLR